MPSTRSKLLLLPIRVPELGPHLGKLVTGGGDQRPGGLALDGVRYVLATRVMEAAGEARRLAARDERDAALEAVGRAVWLAAWEEAAGGVADLLLMHVRNRIADEGMAVRMSVRRRRRFSPTAAEERALRARLGASGAGLVPALDRLALAAAGAREATARERGAVEGWQEALTTCARRLEAAWLALERGVADELSHWNRVAERVAAWRKPVWPVAVVGVVLLPASVWLGLTLGGYVTPPAWFVTAWQRVFG